MRGKLPSFSKFSLRIFIAIFALSFISLNGDAGFLKPNVALAADPAVGLEDNPGIRTAAEVQKRQSVRLMGIPGVIGHGIGISSDGKPVIKIFVERAGIPGIPAALEGVPTKVEVTGMVVAYADPTARFPRPVPIGVSTGHPDITAGTIGCRVIDKNGYVYALSNNHVYANSNDAIEGDSALQPGPYDGGENPADAIGTLADFEPIDFSGGTNTVDAAIALSSISELGTSTPGDGYGIPSSTTQVATINLPVQKYGRTTGWTHGAISEINVTVDVCYETKGPFRCVKSARFINQFSVNPGTFSAGGDSGSLIVTDDANKKPVGLLFAGSSTRTFANPIGPVLVRFDVSVDDRTTISPENYSPNADFSYSTSGLTVNFADQSSDFDGSVVAWHWEFGDNETSTDQNPVHTYAASGTYNVKLTVTDNEGAFGSTSQSVTVSDGSSANITLTATGKQNKKWLILNLVWSGATSANVDIFRNEDFIITTSNDGTYSDKMSNPDVKIYTYKVCEEDSTNICSNEATVIF
jgi:PKD repeat protein